MTILVLGATGDTGQLVVQQGLAGGQKIRALVRSPDKLTVSDPGLEVMTGQATDAQDVGAAMAGVDAVISTLGGRGGDVMTRATRAVIAGADARGVRRVVMLSTFAVRRDRLSPPARLVTKLAMDAEVRDKTTAEDLLRAADVDWTIAHAVRLTNGPATGDVEVVPEEATLHLRDSISHADVAAWLLGATADDSMIRRAVSIRTRRGRRNG
jgi:uncharacterized protein YbjT (DUF2867 family)